MTRFLAAILLAPLLVAPAAAQRADRATPGWVRVRLETADGPMVIALAAKKAPATTANFLRYVDDGRFDGISFYRTAKNKRDPRYGFIQGGIRTDARRFLDTIPHESTKKTGIKHLAIEIVMSRCLIPVFLVDSWGIVSTKKTGIKHLDMTISMARMGPPGSANGNFFISVGALPSMDWSPSNPGYAAFGRVVGGQATVRRILAEPVGGAMKGTLMLRPVRVNRAVRLDGRPQPTGRPRPWLIERRREG